MELFTIFVVIIIYIVYYLLTRNHDYWRKKNVPYLTPSFLFGNYKDTILLKKHPAIVTQEICKLFHNEPYIGTFYGTAPALILLDPELIKLVLVSDFTYFNGREISDYADKETITKNIFFAGGDNWKGVRQNLTPMFTSGKLKNMFHLINSCANQFEILLEEEVKTAPHIEARGLLAKYTIDCITTCAFGLNSNTMKKETGFNPFMKMREQIFDYSKFRGFKINCRSMWPALFYAMKLKLFDNNVVDFFTQLLRGVFASRENMKSSRNDLVDLLLNWKNKTQVGTENNNNEGKFIKPIEVTEELLIGQIVGLFGAGFETTSSTLSFLLYEIAKNPNVQSKVIKEVDSYFEKNGGKIEYECVNEMPYIGACIEETLRLYPVLGVLTREVMESYTLPTGVRLEKGDRIHIPLNYIHRNPDYFEDPNSFKPERFYGDERKNIKPYTFMPFGDGPRICIGLRFSKMPMHAGLLTIFKNYQIELAENMPHSVQFHPRAFTTSSLNDINLKFIPRKV